jgi:hypothetical protein
LLVVGQALTDNYDELVSMRAAAAGDTEAKDPCRASPN